MLGEVLLGLLHGAVEEHVRRAVQQSHIDYAEAFRASVALGAERFRPWIGPWRCRANRGHVRGDRDLSGRPVAGTDATMAQEPELAQPTIGRLISAPPRVQLPHR